MLYMICFIYVSWSTEKRERNKKDLLTIVQCKVVLSSPTNKMLPRLWPRTKYSKNCKSCSLFMCTNIFDCIRLHLAAVIYHDFCFTAISVVWMYVIIEQFLRIICKIPFRVKIAILEGWDRITYNGKIKLGNMHSQKIYKVSFNMKFSG